jgi:RHS repeat-associated protein
VATFEYDAYGQIVRTTGNPALTPFRYQTKWQLAASNQTQPQVPFDLYDYGLRWYHTDQGRFVNRDPIGEAGGENLYAYVGNDPVNRRDLLGLQTTDGMITQCKDECERRYPAGSERETCKLTCDEFKMDTNEGVPYVVIGNRVRNATQNDNHNRWADAYNIWLAGPTAEASNPDDESGERDGQRAKEEKNSEKKPNLAQIPENERKRICETFLNQSQFDKFYGADSQGYYREYGFMGIDRVHIRATLTHHSMTKIYSGPAYYYDNSGKLHSQDRAIADHMEVTSPGINGNIDGWTISGIRRYHTHTKKPKNILSIPGPGPRDMENMTNPEFFIQFSGVFDGNVRRFYQITTSDGVTSMTFAEMWTALECDRLLGLTGDN